MCGIVGLFLKDKSLEPQLGTLLSEMLVTMTDRGPDSAGIAIYGADQNDLVKLTIQSPEPETDFAGLTEDLCKAGIKNASILPKNTHAVITVSSDQIDATRSALEDLRPNVRVMGTGTAMEIYKEVGLPKDVLERFKISDMSGTHGIGHTRMATESAVTTLGAHPFSTGSTSAWCIMAHCQTTTTFAAN